MRAVLDTNIVVSALIWGGKPFELLQAATEGDLLLHTSPALLVELRKVLARPHLAARLERRESSVDPAITLYGGLTVSVTPDMVPRVVPNDRDDVQVIAAAVAAQADLIDSGDRDLLTLGGYHGMRIVTAADAIGIITAARQS